MSDGVLRENPGRGHEVADVDGRRIVLMALGLVAVLIIVAVAAMIALRSLRPDRAGTRPSVADAPVIPTPRLQTAPALDLSALHREKSAMLNEYRWLDKGKGVVRIPIGRAMELTVERSAAIRRGVEKRTEPPR